MPTMLISFYGRKRNRNAGSKNYFRNLFSSKENGGEVKEELWQNGGYVTGMFNHAVMCTPSHTGSVNCASQ
jgi:hypothetical protein